ncbi:hypothetical protein [Lentzea flava]|uniref:MafI family immunity protein n=1 Tax=Lentzea flava TaxID=103732 RepID=A0ABQ2V8N5_9PSEU|nr:hypothetical protein [Lentzea flava]MCP2204059.1 hypothetical protein [Lentzea flava]GGU74505.1 hypothetical protein GCM10010178_77390 [Lentzea flava]
MTDFEPLLRRAVALVPDDARSDAGLSRADVEEYLDHNEFEVALSILEDFFDGAWQDGEFQELLTEAATLLRPG